MTVNTDTTGAVTLLSDEEYAAIDHAGRYPRGIARQYAIALEMRRVATYNPGITMDDLSRTVAENLGIAAVEAHQVIPFAESEYMIRVSYYGNGVTEGFRAGPDWLTERHGIGV